MSVAAKQPVVGGPSIPTWLLAHHEERRIQSWALVAALTLHAALLILPLPHFPDTIGAAPEQNLIRVHRYLPPPPPLERPATAVTYRPRKRLLPVPDPTPDELEPIREPQPEFLAASPQAALELLIGEPEPPPPPAEPETMVSGVAGLDDPVLIPATRVQPAYPELARRAGLEGKVILQAQISSTGGVEQLEIVYCSLPGVGFEAAALAAVRRWRYEPGTYAGRPVGVVLTVTVNFVMLAR